MSATRTVITRRFEFSEGNSNKFWTITVNSTKVVVRFGRIGTQGQATVKSFPDEAAATKHAEQIIHQKVNKGYVEVTQ